MPTARKIDSNGFLTIKACPISSFGIFDYGAGQIGMPGDPNRIVKVYRPESAVNDNAAMDSFKDLPLINDHEMLSGFQGDKSATAPEDYGVSGIINSNVYYDSPWMRGDLKIFARDLQADLNSGKKDLSLGYSCDFEFKPGVFNGQAYEAVQTNLRGNHIALVDEGRVPGARVLDGLCFDHLSFDVVPSDKGIDMTVKARSKAMDNAVAQLKALLPALQQFLNEEATEPAHQGGSEAGGEASGAMATPANAATEAPSTTEGENDAGEPGAEAGVEVTPADPAVENGGDVSQLIQNVEAVLAQLKLMTSATTSDGTEEAGGGTQPPAATDVEGIETGKMTAKAKPALVDGEGNGKMTEDSMLRRFYADAAMKSNTYEKLSRVVGAFDSSSMNASQLASYGVKKLGLKCAAGQETIALDAYFTGIEAAAKATKTQVQRRAADSTAATSELDAYLKGK